MKKADLIYALARRSKGSSHPLSREAAEVAVNLLLEIIQEEISQPEGLIAIDNFGKFIVERRTKLGRAGLLRQGNSPETTTASRVSYHICFKPSDTLKARLQRNRSIHKYKD